MKTITYFKMVQKIHIHSLVLEKAMASHSSTLAWNIPWIEEPSGLQSMGSLRVRYDWANSLSLFTFVHWRRKWQPTPVFLPGKFHGQRSLAGYNPWGEKSQTQFSGQTTTHQQLNCNVVLITAEQESDSVIHICSFFFMFFSITVCQRVLDVVSCALQ